MEDIQYYLEWLKMIELAIYHLFKLDQPSLLKMLMEKYYFKKERIEINGDYLEAVKILEKI